MILVKLRGGLSNQMFQYAAGRRLASYHKTGLKLDVSWYAKRPTNTTIREYELNNFNINASIANENEIIGLDGIRNTKFSKIPLAVFRKIFPKYKFVGEKYFKFDESTLHLSDNVCLFGYWVTEKYFSDIADTIKHEFELKQPMETKNKELEIKINSVNSVSLHVRRGDYITNIDYKKMYDVCDIDYYKKCINYFQNKIKDCVFFVFSDDMSWAKQNLQFQSPSFFVENNSIKNNFIDIKLMSCCKHNIIANSGFSWWGAWLNANKNKIVCAPGKWFNDESYDTNDVIPQSWIKFY